MKMIQAIALALVLVGGAVSLADAQAGQPLQRTDLLKNDIDVPGHEVVQVRVDFAPGVLAAKHSTCRTRFAPGRSSRGTGLRRS